MYQVDTTIEGVSPIRFNRVITVKSKPRPPTEEEEYEIAKQRVYRNSNGLYLPALNLKRALRFGSNMVNLKMGVPGMLTKRLEPFINAAVFIEPTELEFGKDEPDFMFPAYVRIPPGKRGALIFKVRPGLNSGWQLDPLLHVLDNHIEPDKLRMAMETTGFFIGLCDGRPEYGRFIVKKWEVRK